MIVPSDAEYQATKLVKKGTVPLTQPFDTLADWVQETWSVRPLNVIYAPRSALHAPRLEVVFEFAADADRFKDGSSINFDPEKQARTIARFRELAGPRSRFDLEGIFAIFTAFAPVAILEANSRVTKEQIRALQEKIADPALWCIDPSFGSATFMVHTDRQRDERKQAGRIKEYSRAYFDVLKGYDEFGYLNAETFSVTLDSKETFDRDYEGNWFYYYRR